MANFYPDFLNMQPPPNYVAGLGRGATGFTTRSDLGPAQELPSQESIKAAIEQRKSEIEEEEDIDPRYQDPDNEVALFATAPYDHEDEEADKIYQSVEEHLSKRRKSQREKQEQLQKEKYEKENPKVSSQFADLKRGLSTLTDEDWNNIPEPGDLTRKKRTKQPRRERFYATSDFVLASARNENQAISNFAVDTQAGTETPDMNGTKTNFVEIGAARDKVLGIKLAQASSNLTSPSTIDPKGYLTSLNSMVPKNANDLGDIRKARKLLQSVIETNPKHASGWVAAARLEEVANKLSQAQSLILKGCENCSRSEDVWLEAIRLHPAAEAKVIIANAVKKLPKSVTLWLEAEKLENQAQHKKRIIKKALEFNPTSVSLWKEAVNLEEEVDNARILLARAVELIPMSIDLWLALARLETYENAKKVLNKARQTIRTSHEVWIAAARLEEQQGNVSRVEKIMARGVSELQATGGMLQRDQWLSEAEKCETEGAVITAQAIINTCLGVGLDEEDQFDTWLDDAQSFIARKCIDCARAVFAFSLRVYPKSEKLWLRAVELEKLYGTTESVCSILEKAVESCPKAEILWLLYAKERKNVNDIAGARNILGRAFEYNSNSEEIWLAAVRIEFVNNENERARKLLARARIESGTERIWTKSISLERILDEKDRALQLLENALKIYPHYDKLYMMKGQIFEDKEQIELARDAYLAGTKVCPYSIPLWLLLAKLEEKQSVIRARVVFDRAKVKNPKNEFLWLELIKMELRAGNISQVRAALAKALQECPSSGLLWTEAIWLEPRAQRKTRATDALRKCEGNAHLLCTIARMLWLEKKADKARSWFLKAVKADQDNGDVWCWFYKYSLEAGNEDQQKEVLTSFETADPHHGYFWPSITKDIKNSRKTPQELLHLAINVL
ncbi:U4/U6 x U5 tri-snRNP complex subunit Prp1 [Schizosaccharomyces pombe]|uniref:Pre-mRNA-splicing factor prp1 n=1 Tax=Schizosaccharomyces pombe (strain 972 / ATCC 24843) TaxID=284812 RepID=PRP1_SCHPO|nr:U4/U6 x U5 tri-snRNP complex subunit Prp1 [Schizosaccharomyces pombe]Q12381.1 RecName: Full=Pre-mRNA-splicing factor prp1 [Schizosaccharomyces pombe 972h-]BAA12033.1 TPR protein [Schizosaccharomyces pombe]BAA12094.1 pre-mRNA splicing factor [Schizosaccharomyces pombe]CAA17050.1 U4/U6 x U5 tri-snRNP complex subunit Prp1 [Schizosaccharomyces pombe]|eukprot:NP_596086.1 U4/U6 x U5 tri-snRNP complex subunit Prp1 [Schizosaccharomyces pombe]